MSEVKVSMAMLTYFHEPYIEKALNAALNQKTNFDYEIVVSDDCSKDNTLEILRKYEKMYPKKVRVIEHEENVGICRNEYDNWLECRGDYIVVVAGDDMICDENKLQKQIDFLENNKDYFAVGTCIKTVYSDGTVTNENVTPEMYRGRECKREVFLKANSYPSHGIMFRNVLKTKKGREKFLLMCKFHKYIDDITMTFFFFDFGKVFILNDVTYAVTERRVEDGEQHNYNSLFNHTKKAADNIEVLHHLYEYYNHNTNLFYWFEPFTVSLLSGIIKYKRNEFRDHIKYIPVKYIILTILRWPYMRKRIK